MCATVPSTSAVRVLVTACPTIGAPPPTATLPTMTCVVLCRPRGPATSSCGGVIGFFMEPRISGFGDIPQWINPDPPHRAGPVDQGKPCHPKQSRRAQCQSQAVLRDQKATN